MEVDSEMLERSIAEEDAVVHLSIDFGGIPHSSLLNDEDEPLEGSLVTSFLVKLDVLQGVVNVGPV